MAAGKGESIRGVSEWGAVMRAHLLLRLRKSEIWLHLYGHQLDKLIGKGGVTGSEERKQERCEEKERRSRYGDYRKQISHLRRSMVCTT